MGSFDEERKVTVLSIDGGGIRGIIPGVILEELEAYLKKLDGEDARVADYFDVIAGTSTGAILTAMLTFPDPERKDRPRYAASDIIPFYQKWGPEIFNEKPKVASADEKSQGYIAHGERFLKKIKGKIEGIEITSNSVAWILKHFSKYRSIDSIPKFQKPEYKDQKELLFRDTLSKTTVVIPVFSLTNYKPFIFSSHQAREFRLKEDYEELRLTDVVLGSTAAPTYFPPYYLKDNKCCFLDGGLAANNPTLLALCEAKKLNKGQQNYSNYLVLSLGTAQSPDSEDSGSALPKLDFFNSVNLISGSGYGSGSGSNFVRSLYDFLMKRIDLLKMAKAAQELFGILTSANGCMVELYMSRFFRDEEIRKNYLRIQDYEFGAELDSKDYESLKNAGKDLLGKKVMFVNPETGKPEPYPKGTLNKTALFEFAERLSLERKRRLKKHPFEEKVQ